jgi:hypothetical protein
MTEKKKHQGIHERLMAAEVAAEEAAGFGWATEAVEAVEAAVDPERELGKEAPPGKPQPSTGAKRQSKSKRK